MRILLVTSPNEHCGIREYGDMLIESAPRDISLKVCQSGDPEDAIAIVKENEIDLVHLNHHAALHAGWHSGTVLRFQDFGLPVVVTQHDTFEKFSIMMERGFTDFRSANALVVHEPVEGLSPANTMDSTSWNLDGQCCNVYYMHQPVPCNIYRPEIRTFEARAHMVGTVGFDFPWKRFAFLRDCAKKAGWSLVQIGGETWMPRDDCLAVLRNCDATAFPYSTGNSGTSGAIRMGIAARKPVIATPCRQFRDLYDDELGRRAIMWCSSEEEIIDAMKALKDNWDLHLQMTVRISHLAGRDSWENAALRYAQIYNWALS